MQNIYRAGVDQAWSAGPHKWSRKKLCSGVSHTSGSPGTVNTNAVAIKSSGAHHKSLTWRDFNGWIGNPLFEENRESFPRSNIPPSFCPKDDPAPAASQHSPLYPIPRDSKCYFSPKSKNRQRSVSFLLTLSLSLSSLLFLSLKP